jgi:large subunit ribosomal protein L24
MSMEQHQKLHVKKGDMVMVIAGKETGKTGKILKVDQKRAHVIIEKVNFIKRHARPGGKTRQGVIIEREGPLHFSNVNIMCPRCNGPVRMKKVVLEDKKKVRACRTCGEILDQ